MVAASPFPSPTAPSPVPLALLAGTVASLPEPPRREPSLAGRVLWFAAAGLLVVLLAGLVLTAASLRPVPPVRTTPLSISLDSSRLPDAERTQTAPEWLAVRDVPAGPASP